MSADTLLDARHLHDREDDDQDDGQLVEDETELGQWQEELDYSVYAESSMSIPGQGEKGPNCQIWKPAEFCDECADIRYAQNHCGRRSCPHCVGIWTEERAVGITKRLSAKRHTEQKGVDRRIIHATVSPEEGDIRTLQHVYDGFKTAYRIAEEKGIRGGVAIFHAWRGTEEAKEEFREKAPDGIGFWHWIQEVKEASWRTFVYWSPHYHIIGLCRDFETGECDNGWVVHRIDRDGGRSAFLPYEGLRDMESYEEVVGTVRYLMSHASFESGTSRDCVRWFGELSTASFQPEKELSGGAYDVIDRKVREVVGGGSESDESGAQDDESECCDYCGAESWSPIWEAGGVLCDPGWCDRLDPMKERELTAAFKWVIGEQRPPPGLRNPRTEEEAREALEAVV